MASHSVSSYHTHLRTQNREKGEWNNGVLFVCFKLLLLESFLCHWNKRWMNPSSGEFEIDLKE